MNVKISLAQMNILLGRPDENLAEARDFVSEAAVQGSDVVVFPELWSTGYDLANAAAYSTSVDAGIFAATSALARDCRIHVIGSCLSLLGPKQFGNTAVFFDPDGGILGQYTKIHLFQLMDEHKHLTAGDRPTIVETNWGKCGLAICYDLRFPELFRLYALSGAKAVFLVAEWPHPRLTHWRVLLRARAIENQMYVIACNRVGTSGNTRFFGHSCIIDPWGEFVVEAGDDEELLTADIEMEKVDQVRSKIPVFADRRPEVYDNKKY